MDSTERERERTHTHDTHTYRVGDLGDVVLGEAGVDSVAKGAVVEQAQGAVGLGDGHVLKELLHRRELRGELLKRQLWEREGGEGVLLAANARARDACGLDRPERAREREKGREAVWSRRRESARG